MNSNKVVSTTKDECYNKSKKINININDKDIDIYWRSNSDKDNKSTVDELRKELKALEEQENKLNEQLKPYLDELSRLKIESKKNIDKLHVYNEIKESTQMMYGQLAVLNGVTIKQIYKEFGMDLDD